MIKKVSIKHKSGIYAMYRKIQNESWFTIAEFVDNAIQSFQANKSRLREIEGPDFKLRIHIEISPDYRIKIVDNAGGIDSKNFQRAFEPANKPLDPSGLSEFGMGMKIASIWLADRYSVRTKCLSESVERYFQFDLKKVIAENQEEIEITELEKPETEHYTEVILEDLSLNAPSSRQLATIKNHLASIYRKFLRSGELEIFMNDEQLVFVESEILVAPRYNDDTSERLIWKKTIDISFGTYKVHGFIAVLAKIKQGRNGLSLFRRGRVIEGVGDKKYFPKKLTGSSGGFRHKRIFGELELEGFDVTYDKQRFTGNKDFEMLFDHIHRELIAPDFPLLQQADYYRVKSKRAQGKEGGLAKSIVEELQKEQSELFNAEPTILNEPLVTSAPKFVALKDSEVGGAVLLDPVVLRNRRYSVELSLVTTDLFSELYKWEVQEEQDGNYRLLVRVNCNHKLIKVFDADGLRTHRRIIFDLIKSLVIADIHTQNVGGKPVVMRNVFNDLLKYIKYG